MKHWKSIVLNAALLFSINLGTATAGIIFDNGSPNLNPDFQNALGSDFDLPQQSADDFFLEDGASTVTDVHWFGIYVGNNMPPATDNFTIRFFEDDNGEPMANFLHEIVVGNAVNRTATGNQTLGFFDNFKYDVVIDPIELDPLTLYWLSIVNDTPNDDNDEWFWLTSSSGDGNAMRRTLDDGDPSETNWSLNQNLHVLAFSLTNDDLPITDPPPINPIPEPSTMILLGTGLAGIIAWRRKQVGTS